MKVDIKKLLEIADKLNLFDTIEDVLKAKEIDAGLIKLPIDDDVIKEVKEFLDEQGIDVTATLKDVIKKLK
ncbi:MAG: hypothetical protein IJ374_04380 [Lachnospiraceae bacterium]|nr:hypothetical protein [Lachnospiraceae bacterium]